MAIYSLLNQIRRKSYILVKYMNKIDSDLAKHVNLYSFCDFGNKNHGSFRNRIN